LVVGSWYFARIRHSESLVAAQIPVHHQRSRRKLRAGVLSFLARIAAAFFVVGHYLCESEMHAHQRQDRESKKESLANSEAFQTT